MTSRKEVSGDELLEETSRRFGEMTVAGVKNEVSKSRIRLEKRNARFWKRRKDKKKIAEKNTSENGSQVDRVQVESED